jgi:hypothetical protein
MPDFLNEKQAGVCMAKVGRPQVSCLPVCTISRPGRRGGGEGGGGARMLGGKGYNVSIQFNVLHTVKTGNDVQTQRSLEHERFYSWSILGRTTGGFSPRTIPRFNAFLAPQ